MFKFLVVKVSVLSRVPCSRSLRYFSTAVNQKYTLISTVTFAATRIGMPVTTTGFRTYASKVPKLDIEVQADDVWTELCNTNRLPDTDVQNCREIIKLLLSFHYHKNHIIRELAENTVLLKFPISRWRVTVSDLQEYGFKEPQIFPLLAGCHTLLYGTAWENLHEVLMFLQSLQIPQHKRLQIVARNPLLLLSDDTRPLMQNYGNLLKVFTKNEALALIGKSPNLLTDPVEDTNKKINYLYNEMGIRAQEITRSQVFEHSLAHLITRHKFAERAGIYKMPEKHDIEAKEKNIQTVVESSNPSLSDVVDTSDVAFVHSFFGMTVAEYKAFAAMMMEELNKETTDDSDTDLSDSDSDSE